MGIVDKMKDFIGIQDDDYEDDDYEEEEEEQSRKYENRATEKVDTYSKKGNVIKVHSNTDTRVFICEPEKYEDCAKAVDEIKTRRIVVLNIEGLELEDQKQIFEFIKGAVYALNATIQKISNGIFVIAPINIQIDGKLGDRYEKNYIYSNK